MTLGPWSGETRPAASSATASASTTATARIGRTRTTGTITTPASSSTPSPKTTTATVTGSKSGSRDEPGSRDPTLIGYDLPTLTTQSGYAFWKPTYKDSSGKLIHIIPSAWQSAAGADLFLPFDRFDLTTGVDRFRTSKTREAVDGAQLSPYTQRIGALTGFGGYVQFGVWVLGDRSIIGFPGTSKPLHIDLTRPSTVTPGSGVELLAKYEHLGVNYEGASRGGKNDTKTPNGTTADDTVSFGANYWATKHVRVTANYVANVFPNGSTSPVIGNVLHEVAARVGIQF